MIQLRKIKLKSEFVYKGEKHTVMEEEDCDGDVFVIDDDGFRQFMDGSTLVESDGIEGQEIQIYSKGFIKVIHTKTIHYYERGGLWYVNDDQIFRSKEDFMNCYIDWTTDLQGLLKGETPKMVLK